MLIFFIIGLTTGRAGPETVATTTHFINTLVPYLSKADRAAHKNTKTFIPSWLGNHSSRTTSLKTNNYDLDVDFHGHNHLHSSFLFMLSPSLSQISLSPISQFFFFLSSSQFLLILNQLHQEASVRGHVSCKFYLFDSLFEVHVPLLNEEGQCQSGGPAYSCPAVDEHL